MVPQIVLKQLHVVVHAVLVRLLHQRANLLHIIRAARRHHQRVKVDARERVLLRDVRQTAVDAQLVLHELHHARIPLIQEVELAPADLHEEEEGGVVDEELRHQHRDGLQPSHLDAVTFAVLPNTRLVLRYLHRLDRKLLLRECGGASLEQLVVLHGNAPTRSRQRVRCTSRDSTGGRAPPPSC